MGKYFKKLSFTDSGREDIKHLKETKFKCNQYIKVLEETQDGFWEYDIQNDLYSAVSKTKLYLKMKDVSLNYWYSKVHPNDLEISKNNFEKFLKENSKIYENFYRIYVEEYKQYRWIFSKGVPKFSPTGKISRMMGIHIDITDKINFEEKLYNLAYYDSLTTLPNKEKIKMTFENSLANKIQTKNISLVYIDIDNFGYINNSLGYDIGNAIILEFSKHLSYRYGSDNVARINADEFLLLYEYEDSDLNLILEINDLYNELKNINFLNDKEINLFFSIGISIYGSHGTSFDELFKNADVALYYAKKNGKNQFKVYDEIFQKIYNNIKISNQICVALKKEEFELHFQPIMCEKNNKPVGVEALIRWNNPFLGFVPPSKFIPIAEEFGQIIDLEKWIIEEVFKYSEANELSVFISINLSAKGLFCNGITSYIDMLRKKYMIPSEKIEFEITESSLLSGINESIDTIKLLKNMGFKVSLDDFGTGFSSLNYLKILPIDKVKLDKSFIDNICIDNKDQMIVQSIIELSHNIGFEVVAEGVEERNQEVLLKEMTCDFIQGYYYSKPKKLDDVLLWIEKNYSQKEEQ